MTEEINQLTERIAAAVEAHPCPSSSGCGVGLLFDLRTTLLNKPGLSRLVL